MADGASEWDQIVERFRRHLATEKRASPHTVRAYLGNVAEWIAFLRAQDKSSRHVDILTLRSYLASLFERNEAVTIARKLAALRAFCASSSASAGSRRTWLYGSDRRKQKNLCLPF
jgi:integrase/recombinase XerC